MSWQDQNNRTQTRRQLYTGHAIVVEGRGGVVIREGCLLQMWPKYLTSERAALKPTLLLPDAVAMLKQ